MILWHFGLITLILDPPFQLGDWVEFRDRDAGFVSGRVLAVFYRVTHIFRWDGSHVSIPNARFQKLALTNWSEEDDRGGKTGSLIKLTWHVAHGAANIERAVRAVQEINDTMEQFDEKTVKGLRPFCTIDALGEHGPRCELYFRYTEFRGAHSMRDDTELHNPMEFWKKYQLRKQEAVVMVEKCMAKTGARFAYTGGEVKIDVNGGAPGDDINAPPSGPRLHAGASMAGVDAPTD